MSVYDFFFIIIMSHINRVNICLGWTSGGSRFSFTYCATSTNSLLNPVNTPTYGSRVLSLSLFSVSVNPSKRDTYSTGADTVPLAFSVDIFLWVRRDDDVRDARSGVGKFSDASFFWNAMFRALRGSDSFSCFLVWRGLAR